VGNRLYKCMEKRELIIKNARLVDVLNKRNEIQNNINAIVDEIESLQKELNKLGIKMQKEKERAIVETKKLNIELSEFEIIEKFDLNKDGELVLSIRDEVESFKKAYRDRRKENNKVEAPE
jgi:hypothetical protein